MGQHGENVAVNFLEKNQFKILSRNYRCRFGEIDIVAESNGIIHFVEVKNRTQDLVPGRYAVNAVKQGHIRKSAQYYLMQHNLINQCLISFDVVEITDGIIEFLENCFY
ncbi:MAG: YraN family protein [Clostridia bacterium]|nr:YraN family protein [Clostridia bacterium]